MTFATHSANPTATSTPTRSNVPPKTGLAALRPADDPAGQVDPAVVDPLHGEPRSSPAGRGSAAQRVPAVPSRGIGRSPVTPSGEQVADRVAAERAQAPRASPARPAPDQLGVQQRVSRRLVPEGQRRPRRPRPDPVAVVLTVFAARHLSRSGRARPPSGPAGVEARNTVPLPTPAAAATASIVTARGPHRPTSSGGAEQPHRLRAASRRSGGGRLAAAG